MFTQTGGWTQTQGTIATKTEDSKGEIERHSETEVKKNKEKQKISRAPHKTLLSTFKIKYSCF